MSGVAGAGRGGRLAPRLAEAGAALIFGTLSCAGQFLRARYYSGPSEGLRLQPLPN